MVLFIVVIGCSQKEYSIVATQTTGESLSLCASLPEERITESAFKGIELFSYQNEVGEWVFSVLVGTNVTKTYDQVLSDPLTIEELGDCLCKMAADEYVFWLNQAKPGHPTEMSPSAWACSESRCTPTPAPGNASVARRRSRDQSGRQSPNRDWASFQTANREPSA